MRSLDVKKLIACAVLLVAGSIGVRSLPASSINWRARVDRGLLEALERSDAARVGVIVRTQPGRNQAVLARLSAVGATTTRALNDRDLVAAQIRTDLLPTVARDHDIVRMSFDA